MHIIDFKKLIQIMDSLIAINRVRVKFMNKDWVMDTGCKFAILTTILYGVCNFLGQMINKTLKVSKSNTEPNNS